MVTSVGTCTNDPVAARAKVFFIGEDYGCESEISPEFRCSIIYALNRSIMHARFLKKAQMYISMIQRIDNRNMILEMNL